MAEKRHIRIAGIINLTPDSFYSGARNQEPSALQETALRLIDEGASMLDIGACSTRPGSEPVSAEDEMRRLEAGMPAIAGICGSTPLSVDTFRPEVASECVRRWGVSVINDVSGGTEEMFRTVAGLGAGYILTYSEAVSGDVLQLMCSFFKDKLERLKSAGVNNVILDPGFGFGKDLRQSYQILAHLDILEQFGLPIMTGVSRKSMAYRLLDITPENALEATTALNTLAMAGGAEWLRVHDVRAAVQAARIFEEYKENI